MFQGDKLKIKEGQKIWLFNTPQDFDQIIAKSLAFEVASQISEADVLLWFVKWSKEISDHAEELIQQMQSMSTLWICFPKKSSGIQTDLTRDRGWDDIENRTDIRYLTLISLSEDWSAFSMRKEPMKKRVKREIEKWSDTKTKQIVIPPELISKFHSYPEAKEYFDGLAFTHRREYVEWIVSAKKQETREMRLEKMIELLMQKKKTR
jgi:hypothetical protein